MYLHRDPFLLSAIAETAGDDFRNLALSSWNRILNGAEHSCSFAPLILTLVLLFYENKRNFPFAFLNFSPAELNHLLHLNHQFPTRTHLQIMNRLLMWIV
jgi:hypothetical protein